MKITKDYKGLRLSVDGQSYEIREFDVYGDVEIDLDLPLHVLGGMYVTGDVNSSTGLVVDGTMNILCHAYIQGNVVCNDRIFAETLEVVGSVKARKIIRADRVHVYGCIECDELEANNACVFESLRVEKITACNCTCNTPY